jgi:uncharacterized protein (TIGR00251 family)|tara:strand:- start:381 stop:698 length:318 start_codon:yes stop_codon:yes gene_type:complete
VTLPVRRGAAGAFLDIRLTPGAAQNRIEEIFMDGDGRVRLKVKVTAIPEKGKANEALVKLLAKSLKCGKGRIEVAAGKLDRNKTVLVLGDPAETEIDIKKWLETV